MAEIRFVHDILAFELDNSPHGLCRVYGLLQPLKSRYLLAQHPAKLSSLTLTSPTPHPPILHTLTNALPPLLNHPINLPPHAHKFLHNLPLPVLPLLLKPINPLQILLHLTTATPQIPRHLPKQMVDLFVAGRGALRGVFGGVDLYAGWAERE
jgi:hypothetical protein